MAEYLNNLKASSEINEMIQNSNEFLYLISPYIKLSQIFKSEMKRVDSEKVDFSIVYRSKVDISDDDSKYFKTLSGVSLLKCDNLHAKCYINESCGIITSLNLYEHSQTHNHEMGVKFSKEKDPELYNKALKDAKKIIEESQSVFVGTSKKHEINNTNYYSNKNRNISPKLKQAPKKGFLERVGDSILGEAGYCIRCGNPMDFNNSKPFCSNCYSLWAKFKNSEYSEKYCHKCGLKVKTTKSKPICKDCYNKYYR